MIVSWTIKGNDMFPRFPQDRMISAEFVPQNNPNHTESRITLHTTSTPRLCSVAATSSDLYWSHSALPAATSSASVLTAAFTSKFHCDPIEDYYLTPLVTWPPHISTAVSQPSDTTAKFKINVFPDFLSKTTPHTSLRPGQNPFYVTVNNDARLIMCSSFLSSFHFTGGTFSEDRSPHSSCSIVMRLLLAYWH